MELLQVEISVTVFFKKHNIEATKFTEKIKLHIKKIYHIIEKGQDLD